MSKRYQLVTAAAANELDEAVEQFTLAGWEPTGPMIPLVTHWLEDGSDRYAILFTQAVTREQP